MRIFYTFAVALLTILTCTAQDKAARLDSLMTALHGEGKFNGNILVAENGKIIYEKSFGFANEETKQHLNTETIFELASVSKQFTAMGIVLLQKQGKLKYDDKMSQYIPELGFYGTITIRHLLHHTSGLPDYMNLFEKSWDKSKFAVNQDIVNLFAEKKPAALFAPNEKFEYSNTGYALLALIIERVSGKSFGEFLQQSIFKPLEMNNTFVYRSRYAPQKVSNYALGYISDEWGRKILPDSYGKQFYSYYLDGIVGDGTVNSTLHDLLKWDRALYTDKLVNKADKDLIFGDLLTSAGTPTNYGFGWIISSDKKYGKRASHSGGWAGYVSYIDRHLDNDKTVILLQNNMTSKTVNPTAEIRKILYNEGLAVPKLVKITPSTEDLQRYAGVYSNPNFPLKITISNSAGTLTAQATGQSAFPMDAFADHTFTFDPANIKMIFNPDQNTMLFSQGSNVLTFTKE